MDFGLGDNADMIRETTARWAADRLAPRAAEIDEKNEFARDLWPEMGELGLHGITVEEEFGGLGLGALGFITFGAALGAFRLAADRELDGDQTRLIAWTLTLIAAACVGVAAHQLHKRYGSDAVLPPQGKAD